ncbi:haloacid dehalogenase type II [Promicromonospora aerolata]|uniref:Haloacid dehalogenase type II n=1 Tax=Promicromonospora aerolata TaxID=195749 RepID=A0ABW4V2W0_9MICO
MNRPRVLIFDVNETLSDMAPIAGRFEAVGAPAHLAKVWFAGLLRDGFALTVAQENPSFAQLGAEGLRSVLAGIPLNRPVEDAVHHIMAGFAGLAVHPDVPGGVRALADLGIRLVTLSNGSASIAQRLLSEAGLDDAFEAFLSVEQAGIWKPAPGAYTFALESCGVDPMEAMLVAAHPWDTDGACRAGLSAAWINRAGGPYPEYFRPPDLEAPSPLRLAEQLG